MLRSLEEEESHSAPRLRWEIIRASKKNPLSITIGPHVNGKATRRLAAASVAVAWKDSREGRRAVIDALPFLQRAERIQLVAICDDKAAAPATAARLSDVADHLLRHGVKTTFNAAIAEKGSDAAEQLLDIAERQRADLIVAGAYGHSRLQEWAFGGFTRALLAQTERAVLFSH